MSAFVIAQVFVKITHQGIVTRDLRNTNFKNSLEDCFKNLDLIYIGRSEKEIRKDC